MKNKKIANNSATAKARGEINTNLEPLEVQNLFYVCLTQFGNNQILPKIISLWFQHSSKWCGFVYAAATQLLSVVLIEWHSLST